MNMQRFHRNSSQVKSRKTMPGKKHPDIFNNKRLLCYLHAAFLPCMLMKPGHSYCKQLRDAKNKHARQQRDLGPLGWVCRQGIIPSASKEASTGTGKTMPHRPAPSPALRPQLFSSYGESSSNHSIPTLIAPLLLPRFPGQLLLGLPVAVRDEFVQEAAGLALVVAVLLSLFDLFLQVAVCFVVRFVGGVVCCLPVGGRDVSNCIAGEVVWDWMRAKGG